MTKNKKKHGFTMVELLVVVVIIGIISIIVFPSVNIIKEKNEVKKYQKFQESLTVSGELFTDSFHEDMFGIKGDGCYDIPFELLLRKNLAKDFKTNGITCKTSDTFVHVVRKNGKYSYDTSIKCLDELKNVVYEDVKSKCGIMPNLSEKPVISAAASHLHNIVNEKNWSAKKDISIYVSAGKKLGLNSNVQISYGFSNTEGVKPTVDKMVPYRYTNKYNDKSVAYTFNDQKDYNGNLKNGKYYLFVSGEKTYDTGAHNADDMWYGPLYYDNEKPSTPVINNPYDNKWVGRSFVDENKYVFEIKSHDTLSGVAYYQYRFPDSSDAKEQIWKTYSSSSGDSFTITPLKKQRNEKMDIRACDFANNCSDVSSTNIKIDRTSPSFKISKKEKGCDHVSIEFETSDNESGINANSIIYKSSSDDWKDLKDNKAYAKGNVTFRIYDNASNYTDISDELVFRDCNPKPDAKPSKPGAGCVPICLQYLCEGGKVYQKCQTGDCKKWTKIFNGQTCTNTEAGRDCPKWSKCVNGKQSRVCKRTGWDGQRYDSWEEQSCTVPTPPSTTCPGYQSGTKYYSQCTKGGSRTVTQKDLNGNSLGSYTITCSC